MKVNITPTLKMKLDMLSSEYRIEIGGYLIGEIKDGIIMLQDILIPSQRISVASVEINPKHQIELLKKYGSKKCKKIIGHWHSHHNMGCFWSGTDMNNMENIMTYKSMFIFIVSSNKSHLIKVCLKDPIKIDIDEVDLYIKSLTMDLFKKRVENIIDAGKNNSSINYDNIVDKEKKEFLNDKNDTTEETSYVG